MSERLKVADEVWFGAALLQKESNNKNNDFSVKEIIQKIFNYFTKEVPIEDWNLRPGVMVHVNLHCVANKTPNPNTLCFLFETSRGRRRLFRKGDLPHEWRTGGRTKPELKDIPVGYPSKFKQKFEELLEWYDKVYNK